MIVWPSSRSRTRWILLFNGIKRQTHNFILEFCSTRSVSNSDYQLSLKFVFESHGFVHFQYKYSHPWRLRWRPAYDVAVEIGHDHDIKLLWSGDQLHRGVVHDHLVKDCTSKPVREKSSNFIYLRPRFFVVVVVVVVVANTCIAATYQTTEFELAPNPHPL